VRPVTHNPQYSINKHSSFAEVKDGCPAGDYSVVAGVVFETGLKECINKRGTAPTVYINNVLSATDTNQEIDFGTRTETALGTISNLVGI